MLRSARCGLSELRLLRLVRLSELRLLRLLRVIGVPRQDDYFGGVDADRAEVDDIAAKLDQLAAAAARCQ